MVKKIDKLTDKQIASIPEWVGKWVKIGLSCEPADFEDAERGVHGCYRAAGLCEPMIVLRMSSPYGAVLGGNIARLLLQQVGSQVGSQVESQVYSQVGSQVYSQAIDNWYCYRGGNMWSAWYAWISFFRDICHLEILGVQNFEYDELHALNAGWCWYHDHVAAISDRPQHLKFNESGQGHCEDGPAFLWRDGWAIWLINGIAVNEQIVMRPESQSISQIKSEENEEIRRIRIERFGWDRFIRESGANLRNKRFNERDHQWEELYMLDDGTQRILLRDPSTGRKYALGVPAEIDTCESAQSWMSHGLDKFAIHRS